MRTENFVKLVKQLEKLCEHYGLKFVGGAYDSDGNLRTFVVSDNLIDRDEVLDIICEQNADFDALVANRFEEEELH